MSVNENDTNKRAGKSRTDLTSLQGAPPLAVAAASSELATTSGEKRSTDQMERRNEFGTQEPVVENPLKKQRPNRGGRGGTPHDFHETVFHVPDGRPSYNHSVNLNCLAGRSWGQHSVLQYVTVKEVDSLVGWATHDTLLRLRPDAIATRTNFSGNTTNNLDDGDNEIHSTSAGMINSSSNTRYDINCSSQFPSMRTSSAPNPLSGVQPDGPLPYSLLDSLLHEKARHLAHGKPLGMSSATGKSLRKKTTSKKNKNECKFEGTLKQCDTSAQVAIGMVLEEAMTAALLPLAEYHVRRCRQLEAQEDQQRAKAGEVTATNRLGKKFMLAVDNRRQDNEIFAFHQWTLPPEEGIFNIMACSLSRPTRHKRATVTTSPGEVSANEVVAMGVSSQDIDDRNAENATKSNHNNDERGCNNNLKMNETDNQQTGTLSAHNLLPSTCPRSKTQEINHGRENRISEATDLQQKGIVFFLERQTLSPSFVQNNLDVFQWLLPLVPRRLEKVQTGKGAYSEAGSDGRF